MIERTEIHFKDGSIAKILTEKKSESDVTPIHKEKEESSIGKEEEPPKYVIGSRFLHKCNKHLMSRSTEVLADVSGFKHNGIYTLETLEPLKLDESSMGYAKSNLMSTKDTLIDLHRYGHLLTAVFHSHPESGPDSVHPSSTDINNQKRLENAGFKNISGIFSRDGYVRFFTINNPFQVVIEGKGVKHVQENLYKLTKTPEL